MMGKRGPEKNTVLEERIGARIYRVRMRKRLTLQVLADRAGLHLNTVHRAENGFGATVLTLCRIAKALDVGIEIVIPDCETFVKSEQNPLSNRQHPRMIRDGSPKLFPES